MLTSRWQHDAVNNLTEVTVMFTKQQKARILAEAKMHIAIRNADVAREKYLLMLQKEKMAERHPARDSQHGARTYDASGSRPIGFGSRRH
jgi:hypothetical protein